MWFTFGTIARGLAVGALLGTGMVLAQPASGPAAPSLSEAVDSAWRIATGSAVAVGRADLARAEGLAAAAPWAASPSFEIAYRDDRFQTNAGERDAAVGVAVPLWLPGQRQARRDSADAESASAAADALAARHRIARQVIEAAWDIALRRSELALALNQASVFGRLAEDVARRVEAGDLARADALAARAEALEAESALSGARTRLEVSLLRWRALTGLEAAPALERAAPLATPGVVPDTHPELQAARRSVEAARRRLEVARSDRRDPPELIARLQQETAGPPGGTANSVALAIRVPLATEGRNAPLLAVAGAALGVAEATERQLMRQLQAAIDMAQLEATVAERDAAQQRARAQLLRERAALIEKAFSAGETALPELLRTLSAAAQADAEADRLDVASALAQARLGHALGVFP